MNNYDKGQLDRATRDIERLQETVKTLQETVKRLVDRVNREQAAKCICGSSGSGHRLDCPALRTLW